PITLAHAVRSLLLDTAGLARQRWVQRGFRRPAGSTASMRTLMGQIDGTVNPRPGTPEFDDLVWVGDEGPSWLRGGTGLVVRRIRMNLAAWDLLDPPAKEEVIGRRLSTGAPLTGTRETDPADLGATSATGLSAIPDFAHIRHAAAVLPRERFLRRPYNYDERATGAGEDSGLVFMTFQRDITEQFVPVQRRLADKDLLNMWTTPVGSAVFAILPGAAEGEYLGERLYG
ncbi:MAG TPA: Dyp-type peroxidase, partial [Candidatus Lustribacter sp.]|nr:Dyp-type peroxidase [Candidatus Lustribacter sp.]